MAINESITEKRPHLSRCGVDIRGRSRKLYINYRTTDEIRRAALAYLEGCDIDDLDDGSDESKRYKSLSRGPAPVTSTFGNLEEASQCLSGWINDLTQGEERTLVNLCDCIVQAVTRFRTRASQAERPQDRNCGGEPVLSGRTRYDLFLDNASGKGAGV
jgi:hypothetical protein